MLRRLRLPNNVARILYSLDICGRRVPIDGRWMKLESDTSA